MIHRQPHLCKLVCINQHNIALLFTHYLLSIGIAAEVKSEDDGFAIYCDEKKLDLAKQTFDEFIQQPFDPKYQQAAWQSGAVTQVSQSHSSLYGSLVQPFLAHAGLITLVVFTLCWLVFIGSLLGWGQQLFQAIHFYEQLNITVLVQQPQRLLGPAFFHFSWLHIVFNTMWWWQLGGSIEQTLGKRALINLFLMSAIVSNVGQFMVSGPNFGGLSGVVYGLVGYVWWMGWLAPQKGLVLSKPIVGFLLFWLLLGFTEVLPVNMANTAHLLGLVSGCTLAWFKIKVIGR